MGDHADDDQVGLVVVAESQMHISLSFLICIANAYVYYSRERQGYYVYCLSLLPDQEKWGYERVGLHVFLLGIWIDRYSFLFYLLSSRLPSKSLTNLLVEGSIGIAYTKEVTNLSSCICNRGMLMKWMGCVGVFAIAWRNGIYSGLIFLPS